MLNYLSVSDFMVLLMVMSYYKDDASQPLKG